MGDKLKDLAGALTGLENELLRRKMDKQDDTIDDALNIINGLADDGTIEIDGECCGDDDDFDDDEDDDDDDD